MRGREQPMEASSHPHAGDSTRDKIALKELNNNEQKLLLHVCKVTGLFSRCSLVLHSMAPSSQKVFQKLFNSIIPVGTTLGAMSGRVMALLFITTYIISVKTRRLHHDLEALPVYGFVGMVIQCPYFIFPRPHTVPPVLPPCANIQEPFVTCVNVG
ncbi:hypothetical protein EVAR_79175_1 [Eumeta japonica]|uniref:Uncharacterized protein n=1 Tax=Eumeta variegata TaxID=151549 RepID=A0A4C1UUG7_EUMVA|nr:hypothetical protein EVAR_79175_1 [Eumeta japonica]